MALNVSVMLTNKKNAKPESVCCGFRPKVSLYKTYTVLWPQTLALGFFEAKLVVSLFFNEVEDLPKAKGR